MEVPLLSCLTAGWGCCGWEVSHISSYFQFCQSQNLRECCIHVTKCHIISVISVVYRGL